MRPTILFILTIFISFKALCQNNISSIVKQSEILTAYYEMATAGSKVLYLPMNYGKSDFSAQQKEAIKSLNNAVITRIDLAYSDYPAKADFSPLTKARLEALQKILPNVFSDRTIEFRKVRQTIGTTKDVASGLQHGFFIYFRPLPTKGSGKEEALKLKSLLTDKAYDKSADDTTDFFWCSQTAIYADTTETPLPAVPSNCTRTITIISIKDAVSRELIPKDYIDEYQQWGGDSVFCIEDRRNGGCDGDDYFVYDQVDTTVTQVFKRNNWKRSFIIADVTGSMYPYAAQLLKWIQLNLTDKEKRYFCFFNDGDNKDEGEKVIGKTGGIYPVFTSEYDEVEKTITKAMENGSGGDAPENNMEALLESNKICKDCDSIIMIADNWAPIKDISLLAAYHKPVKVVLCGVFDKINEDYLKLARDTKGSIHLIEEDIYTLSELREGETIKIHRITYKLIEGNFTDITPKSL